MGRIESTIRNARNGEHAQKTVSAAVAIAVTAVFFHTLMALPPIPPWPESRAERLQVFWIKRPQPRAQAAPRSRRQMEPAPVAVSQRARQRAPDAPASDVGTNTIPVPVENPPPGGEDIWAAVEHGNGQPPGLPGSTFERNPFERPGPDPLAVAPKVRIQVADGSWRGRLARMSQAASCSHMSRLFRANDSDLARMGTTRQGLAHAMASEGCAPPP